MIQFKFSCKTIEDTQALAAVIGEAMKGGEVIEFVSDLGGGKTTFIKGLAKGMGVTGVVQSPTFIISSIHKGRRGLELHHFDFYRLDDAGIMSAELAESLSQPNTVVAVEWGEVVHTVLPKDRATLKLSTPEAETRVVTIELPKNYDHLSRAIARYKEQGSVA